MTTAIQGALHSRIVNALFDTQAAATQAVDDLVAAGIAHAQITQTAGTSSETAAPAEDKGFWESLKDLFIPEDDRYTYAEGLRRGGYLVSVKTSDAEYDRVIDILDREGSIDLDERETQWRADGWTGYAGEGLAASAASGSSSAPAAPLSTGGSEKEARVTAFEKRVGTLPADKASQTADLTAGRDETLQTVEERLNVGKRDVNHGRVRLRSYVVETPVSEQVNLRDETVFVDRHAVDRPVAATDALFQDRVIEMEEHREEAVVAKEARVTGEVSLRKTSEERVQTVSDAVRRTEVEVQDDRNAGRATGTKFLASTDATRIVEHMDVISADGQKVGTVDHLDGPDRIKLAKSTSPDGQHHLVPFAWIDRVDQHVHLKKTLAEIKSAV